MNLLNLELEECKKYAIDAYTHIYGKKYRSIIKERIDRAIINLYNDVDGLNYYIDHLKNVKKYQLSLSFFKQIGYDITEYDQNRTIELFNDYKFLRLCRVYLGDPFICFKTDQNVPINYSGLEAPDYRVLELINEIYRKEKITSYNFEQFKQTEDYQKIIEKIKIYNQIYNHLIEEYENYEKSLLIYQEYIDKEKNRKSSIYEYGIKQVINKIYPILPPVLQEKVNSLSLEEIKNLMFGEIENNNFTGSLLLDFFNDEYMDELYSKDTNLSRKKLIIELQMLYLKCFDIDLPDEINSEDSISGYLKSLKQYTIEKVIPQKEIINQIHQICDDEANNCLNKYFIGRTDFKDIVTKFNLSDNYYNWLIRYLKERLICVTWEGATVDNQYASVMFYTIRHGEFGALAHVYLHELGHIIDDVAIGATGLEMSSDEIELNPYDNKKRKYEIFNEVLTDLFAIEAEQYLNNKRIYLFEDKNCTKLDHSNINTNYRTKNILKPLVELCRDYIIKAKIGSDRTILSDYIGEDNFEALVDTVNKVEFLCNDVVRYDLERDENNLNVLEYKEQLKRAKNIYNNIEKYILKSSQNNYSMHK